MESDSVASDEQESPILFRHKKRALLSDQGDEELSHDGGAEHIRGKKGNEHTKKVDIVEDSDDSDVEEELLDLLDEDVSEGQMGRLKSKASVSASKDISRIFEDEVDDDINEYSPHTGQPHSRQYMSRDEMDDFITDDDGSEKSSTTGSEDSNSKGGYHIASKFARPEHGTNKGDTLMNDYFSSNKGFTMSESMCRDINCLFGNGSDYAWALNANSLSKNFNDADGITATEKLSNNEDKSMIPSRRKVELKDIYDAKEIERNMMTKEDNVIRNEDLPERFQTLDVTLGNFKDFEHQSVVNFIYAALMEECSGDQLHRLRGIYYTDLTNSISKIIKYTHVSAFEIPYIYYYRRDYIDQCLTMEDLWKIHDLDIKFAYFDKRRKATKGLYDKIISSFNMDQDPIFEKEFSKCENEDSVDDISAYLNFKYYSQICEIDSKKNTSLFKRVIRVPQHELARRSSLENLSKLFNIDIPALLDNDDISNIKDIQYHTELPQKVAENFVCEEFPTPELALAGARQILICSLANNPALRASIKKVAILKSLVSVDPTPKGIQDIDVTHPYYAFKYLTNKKYSKFIDGQFAQIVSAENENLLKIVIEIEDQELLLDNLKSRLKCDFTSDLNNAWSRQRIMVIESAFNDMLLPEVRKYIRKKLFMEANAYIVNNCQKKFEERVNMAPFRNDSHHNESTSCSKTFRVISVTWGDGKSEDPTYFIALKKTGEISEWKAVLNFRKIVTNLNSSEAVNIYDFISTHSPTVIAIAGFRPNLKTQLYDYLTDFVRAGLDSGKLEKDVPTIVVNDEFARIYVDSKFALKEFPDQTHPRLVRYCISLGRYVQNPVTEVSRLFNYDNDISNLILSPLQNFVPFSSIFQAYERALINVVSICGVDINALVKNSHMTALLQFVPGLGPRKAQALLSKLELSGLLRSRTDLIKRKMCKANVFMNCAAFIRVRQKHFKHDLNNSFDILDDTRIHPVDYDLARKMAADTLDIDDSMLEYEENRSQHVRELMESKNIDKISQLALDEFAIELEKRMNEKKKLILHDIVNELLCPFKEKRPAFKPATPEQIFEMVTNETTKNIYEGLVLPAQVTFVSDRVVRCKLSCSIDCTLDEKNVKKTGGIPLSTMFYVHQTILCKILKLDLEKLYAVVGYNDDNDFQGTDPDAPVDEYFDISRETKDLIAAAANNEQLLEHKKSNTQKNNINHPLFQSLDQNRAYNFLSSKPQGSIVIYPSQEAKLFHISCKPTENNSFMTIDMEMKMNFENKITNKTVFTINGKIYGEIDQIIAEYIEPISRRILSLYRHPKFKNLDYVGMAALLESNCSSTKRSSYGFIPNAKSPENLILVYCHPMSKVRIDVVTATPDGYQFREKTFHTIDEMLNFFKESETAKHREQQQHLNHYSRSYHHHSNPSGYPSYSNQSI